MNFKIKNFTKKSGGREKTVLFLFDDVEGERRSSCCRRGAFVDDGGVLN